MELREIDESTAETFFRCLHDERPADPRVLAMRRAWRAHYAPKGHRAKVLIDSEGQVVGLTNYIPVEHSPYEGRNLMAILCMWIHGYDHLVGNQQARGYGRFMLGEIEADARRSGCNGMVVWAKDYAAWNPVSFYEHMGYRRAEVRGLDVLAWKPFNAAAEPPAFLPEKRPPPPVGSGPVEVVSVSNGWCGGGCEQCVMARDAVAGMKEVAFTEVYAHEKQAMRERGESIDVIYVDGEPFRPDGPPASAADLREELLRRFQARNGKRDQGNQ
jgi:GNAT superfamily N-acetyltransferase